MPDTPITLRAFQSDDLPGLVQLFHDSVHRVASRLYTPEQVAAWAPKTTDLSLLQAKLDVEEVAVAESGDRLAGFCAWDADGYLDFLYVHPDCLRRGVATLLCERAEWSLRAQGCPRVHTQASLIAQPFFLKRGYRIVRHQIVTARGVELPNAVMEKTLD